MIVKIIYMSRDKDGNYPVDTTSIYEADRISWWYSSKENGSIFHLYFADLNNSNGVELTFPTNHKTLVHEIYFENDKGKTINRIQLGEIKRK
jgi:hypothetical protein